MSVTPKREPIYVALWDLVANDSGIAGEFVTSGRFLIPISDLPAGKMPALFLIQHGERWVRAGKGIPNKRTLDCSFIAYAHSGSQKESLPATLINNMLDVLEAVIEQPGNPGFVQRLGGLVEHVYMEDNPKIIEGQLGSGENASVLVAPITILLP